MSEQERPLSEVMHDLAMERAWVAAGKERMAWLEADIRDRYKDLYDTLAAAQSKVAKLESEIRTRGAAIAAETRQAPCPGTKVRNERVIRYIRTTADGEIVAMDAAVARQHLVTYAVNQGWQAMLKPDQTAIEKALKALPDEARPEWAREEWQTVVSIDSDLSALLELEQA